MFGINDTLIYRSTNALFAIPSNQEFVFFQSQQKDMFTFLLDLLNETFEIGNGTSSDFYEFLHQHIELAQTKGNLLLIS